jgi:hypothetical protein
MVNSINTERLFYTLKVLINSYRRVPSSNHRSHNQIGSSNTITAGEDPRAAGSACAGISDDQAPFMRFEFWSGLADNRVWPIAEG